MLTNYLGEHLQRARTGTAIAPALLRLREGFTRKLDLAIGEQSEKRDELDRRAELHRQQLLEHSSVLSRARALVERLDLK